MATNASLREEVTELTRTLQSLQRELEPGDRRLLRPPTPRELRRFTTEVTIPAAILVLETNVRALQLLQRALRHPDDRRSSPADPVSTAGRRAVDASLTALDRLDDTLAELQRSLEPDAPDDRLDELLAEARRLQDRVATELRAGPEPTADTVPIDVEAELASIKDDLDEDDE